MGILYRKEHGFPMDVNVETELYEDKKENWAGFKSYMNCAYLQIPSE